MNYFKNKNLKIFLISFIASLPFWAGVNILAGDLENIFYWEKITGDPQILAARINQNFLAEELKKLKEEAMFAEQIESLEIKAKAALSIEINNTGGERILFEKNAQTPLPIASLTKLMTALVVFDLKETYDLSQTIAISKEAIEQEGFWGELRPGESLSIEALLYIMLIESSNDAAYALTDLIGQEGFVNLMNIYAKNLGLKNTYFINSTGLDADEPLEASNTSTVEDFAKLAKYILKKYPKIFEISANYSYEILRPNGSLHHFISENTNKLLLEIPEIIGGKTGWSPAAGGCLLIVLEKPQENGYFINIILGSNDRFGEMRKIIEKANGSQLK